MASYYECYGLIYNKTILEGYCGMDGAVVSSIDEINSFETLNAVCTDINNRIDEINDELGTFLTEAFCVEVWGGFSDIPGAGSGSFTAGRSFVWFSAPRTPYWTQSNTFRSERNFTSVLAGWTFTSTALTGRVKWSTQAGNLPTMI